MTSAATNSLSAPHVFKTRVAGLADAPALAMLGAKTFSDTFAQHNTEEDMRLYLEKTFTTDQLRSEILDSQCTFILALDGDAMVGYAKLRQGESPPELTSESGNAIEIARIYALQHYVGKNVGRTLLQTCIEMAIARGMSVIWLGVWEHNPRAIAFYEKWGFKKFGSHPFLLGNDLQTDLLMKKNLT